MSYQNSWYRGQQNKYERGSSRNENTADEEIKALIACINNIKKLRELLEISNDRIRMEEIVDKVCRRTTQNQVRKFYDRIKEIERKLEYNKGGDYENIRLQLSLLIPKLVYAGKRGSGINKNFVDFMNKAILEVNKSDDKNLRRKFKNFVSLLESMIAFMKKNK